MIDHLIGGIMLTQTKLIDMPKVLNLYQQASEDLAKANIDQWQNNYPNQQSLQEDIDQGYSYVFYENGEIVGTCALIWDGDDDYQVIHEGHWLNDLPYLTIHRIVVERSLKGTNTSNNLMQAIIELALSHHVHSIRVDTHQDNLTMQGFLKKHGFVACGVVYIRQKDRRLAFQKNL